MTRDQWLGLGLMFASAVVTIAVLYLGLTAWLLAEPVLR